MQKVAFGKTDLGVSRLCLGTMTFGVQCDEPTSVGIMDAAAAGGINFIDTADVYPLGGDKTTFGRTEEIVGRWLKGRRKDFVLATKCGALEATSRTNILTAIDASLKRLGTDYVDLYQLHRDDAETPMDEALEALDTVVRSGKARYIGVSNWLAYRIARALGKCETHTWAPVISSQPRYNLLFRQFERELFPLCRDENIAVMPYNPLAGGMLTGKYDRKAKPTEGRFTIGTSAKMYQDRYWHDRQMDAIEALRPIAADAGLSMVQMAVGWTLANPTVTSVIIGASRAEQLADNLAAANDFPLPPELKTRLDDATQEWRNGDALR